jgi:hypothetical protein
LDVLVRFIPSGADALEKPDIESKEINRSDKKQYKFFMITPNEDWIKKMSETFN